MTPKPLIKLDLHVHSPASIDFMGNKGSGGYADLIRAFVDEEVDAIALTDHNTINGYLEYRKQVDDTRETYRLMAARDESSEVVKDLKCEVERFGRLRVLPGVEITAYPNIHVILIFDDAVVSQVTGFLADDVGLEAAIKLGDPKISSKLSVISLLDLATQRFGDRFFCILPHIESSKGAWTELDGVARADLFRDERVVAVQFSNPVTVEHVNKALGNGAYKRKTPLGFIQASDYHGDPNVKPASQFTVLEREKPIEFDSLRSALSDRSCTRCSNEFVEDRLARFLNGRPHMVFEFTNKFEIDAERRRDLARALCGSLNSGNAVIQINLLNVADANERSAETVSKIFKELQELLDPAEGFDFAISQFHQSTFRQRFCITISRNSKLRLFEGICWILDEATPRPASAWRIEQIVASAHYTRLGQDKQKALESASTDLLRVSSAFPAIEIAARLEPLLSRMGCGPFEMKVISPNYPTSLKDNMGCLNGYSDGDFIQLRQEIDLKGGRLEGQRDYYRFSAPQFKYGTRTTESSQTVGPNAVIVFPDGGVNFVYKPMCIFAPFPVLQSGIMAKHQLGPKADLEISLGFAAWLKSSFLLWYLNSVYQTDDVFDVMMENRRIPLPADVTFLQSLAVFAKNIITAENAVLTATAKENPTKDESLRISQLLSAHNQSVKDNMRMIDKEIFRHLAFREKEVREVYRVLRVLDLYDYGISSSLDELLKELDLRK